MLFYRPYKGPDYDRKTNISNIYLVSLCCYIRLQMLLIYPEHYLPFEYVAAAEGPPGSDSHRVLVHGAESKDF